MKRKTSGALSAILFATGLSLASAGYAAPAHKHDGHEAHGNAAGETMQLNAGKKWGTDESLRKSMSSIRQAVAASLHEIHENRLKPAGYLALARKVEGEVGNIVANCKLEPKADAQLHLVVADLLSGAEQMAGKIKKAKRQDGAVKVIGALEKYAAYFDDPQFKPIAH
ncbi:MAG: hypothetical protein KKF85_00385 [Gammaproteobacteria bacterium]|nr:hypothetical protein [Rhodocyclaceae bacterium]MBU3910751.1 hypothetical protein [Gammaproteobacteria bacterium]MBU3988916.1 hypothetical protein [Gammaproteobacteria bacterium]MBU4003461.1 hypothetical protein [Gammaproteobacteria bacterium]MBU4021932.1 hypothetical protein [Gammaproteobacteria bacterium]